MSPSQTTTSNSQSLTAADFNKAAISFLRASQILSEKMKSQTVNEPRAMNVSKVGIEVIIEKKEDYSLAGPCLHLLAHAIELVLKARLMESDDPEKRDPKKHGHDLYKMWNYDEFQIARQYAQEYAETLFERDENPFPDPKEFTVDFTLKFLSDLATSRSHFALRYPRSRIEVPDPALMIEVFKELICNRAVLFATSDDTEK